MDDVMQNETEAEAPKPSPEQERKAQLAAKAPILTGSGAILRSLELLGIKDVFGLPEDTPALAAVRGIVETFGSLPLTNEST